MDKRTIVLLGGQGVSTNIVFHAIDNSYGTTAAIVEEKESTILFIKRRIKRLGFCTVFGQLLFQTAIAKLLRVRSQNRIEEIIRDNQLDRAKIPSEKLINVRSINSAETIELLKQLKPNLIIVNGTRILSKELINSVNCKLINTHAGITPKYRGVHGAYWAIANNDHANCGVTVHFVDEGIDTGNIIDQKVIAYTDKDNFSTYPFIQLAEGVKLLKEVVKAYYANTIQIKNCGGESKLWYHPTIWQYLYYRIRRNVK
ncbi:formyl transferase [Campylobacterota bacterium]|nr:formyl transferase [Campylobacterota bacterium]